MACPLVPSILEMPVLIAAVHGAIEGKVVVLLRDRLVGTFVLVSLEVRRSDGEISHPLGEQPSGMFIFDRDQNFSVQLMDPDRDVAAGDGYAAMWGTYEVDEDQHTFTITPEGALQPALVGAATVRHVNFLDGVAVFNTTPQVINGIETATYITWRKVTSS
jgi:Lipocalin-like domain